MRYSIILLLLTFWACENPAELQEAEEFQGPLREAEDVELYYSELTKLKTKVISSKVWEYENGDREFPEGIFLEFYDDNGNITSTLKADKAYFDKEKNLWRGVGDVIVENTEKGQQLKSEELFWEPDKEKIYTNVFVTVREGDQVLYGTGLEAKQDFSSWFIKNVEGEFYLDEE